MRGIPAVKAWRVRTNNSVYSVLAPTRKLAVMNLRAEGIYDAIRSVGVRRNVKRSQHATVCELNED